MFVSFFFFFKSLHMFVVQCGAGKSCPQFYRFAVVINLMLALMAIVWKSVINSLLIRPMVILGDH